MRIFLDYDFSNLNKIIAASRTYYGYANDLKKKEMKVVEQKVKDLKPITEYPLKITFIWHFKTRQRDLDNCIPKNILDALVSLKILKNDNLNCIREIHHKSIMDKNWGVELIIEKWEENQ